MGRPANARPIYGVEDFGNRWSDIFYRDPQPVTFNLAERATARDGKLPPGRSCVLGDITVRPGNASSTPGLWLREQAICDIAWTPQPLVPDIVGVGRVMKTDNRSVADIGDLVVCDSQGVFKVAKAATPMGSPSGLKHVPVASSTPLGELPTAEEWMS